MEPIKFFTKSNILKLGFESTLIIFSVLLALFLNEYRGQLREGEQKELAMKMVEIELRSNLEIINEWLPYHQEVLKNLNEELQGDATKNNLFDKNGELKDSLMSRGVVQRVVDNGSWQTLRASNVSSTIDFNTILTLSKLYKLQAIGVESTLDKIVDILSSRESLDQKNYKTTIALLRNAFSELVSQERFLIHKYEQAFIEIGIQNGV